MRKFINIITEKWDQTLPSGEEVFRNPSAAEFNKLKKSWGGDDYDARLSFTRNGDILLFDAGMSTHDDVAVHYGSEIDPDYPTAMVMNMRGGFGIYLHHAYSFANDHINAVAQQIMRNQNIIRMLGQDFPFMAESDDGDMINLRYQEYVG